MTPLLCSPKALSCAFLLLTTQSFKIGRDSKAVPTLLPYLSTVETITYELMNEHHVVLKWAPW